MLLIFCGIQRKNVFYIVTYIFLYDSSRYFDTIPQYSIFLDSEYCGMVSKKLRAQAELYTLAPLLEKDVLGFYELEIHESVIIVYKGKITIWLITMQIEMYLVPFKTD